MTIVNKSVTELIPYARNSRTHNDEQVSQIMASIKEFGFTNPILTDGKDGIIAGHGRLMAAQRLGIEEVPTIELSHLTEAQKKAYIIADNKLALNSGWDEEMLKIELSELDDMGYDMDLTGFDKFEIDALFMDEEDLVEEKYSDGVKGSMNENFLFSPFSVLNGASGRWQERKKAWIQKGIKSEEGRDLKTTSASSEINVGNAEGGSIFDPVLAELSYVWFCPPKGTILDPFAGGSVRGIVASMCGRQYIGGELRKEQVDANMKQANDILVNNEIMPVWINDDSLNIDINCKDVKADMLFTCPPYADLEVYSDNEKDLSNMEYSKFKEVYFEIIKKSCSLLKDNTFAVIVVGEVRDKKGNYYNVVGDTINAFLECGLSYYNEIIYTTPTGSLPLRAGKIMVSSRKIGKMHQNVLVFLKGDAKKATQACGVCEFGEIEEDLSEQ